jgi:hypothetical protein
MSSLGYTIFGRPVQHEYVSNGLFNELNLNSETYLSDRIELKKGQSLAILKRQKDQNGIESIFVLLYTYAISYNGRGGGFVGAGIAFNGQPSTKLIYHQLKQLHQQSLSLLESTNFKFKSPKINIDQIKLPDLSEDGLFVNRTSKKYVARDMAIGVKIAGNFYENLMGAIQGFCFNENYFAVKTAYVTNSADLLRNLVPSKSIYQLHNLLDFQNVYIKYNKHLNETKKKVDEDINKKRQDFIKDKEDLENQIKSYQNDIFELKKEVTKLRADKRELYSQKVDLSSDIIKVKQKNFKQALNKYPEEREAYEKEIVSDYKKELSKKIDWIKVIFAISTVVFIITSIVLSYYLYKNNNKLKTIINELEENKTEKTSLEEQSELKDIPKKLTVNEFFKLDDKEKEEHKSKIKDAINLISNNRERVNMEKS